MEFRNKLVNLIRIKLPLQAAFRALTFRPRLIIVMIIAIIVFWERQWNDAIWVSDQGPVARSIALTISLELSKPTRFNGT